MEPIFTLRSPEIRLPKHQRHRPAPAPRQHRSRPNNCGILPLILLLLLLWLPPAGWGADDGGAAGPSEPAGSATAGDAVSAFPPPPGSTAHPAGATLEPAGQMVFAAAPAGTATHSTENHIWERAKAPRPLAFPADHGQHPAFQTEWWYVTGNLDAADGRSFGYQFTIFRQGISRNPHSGNPWSVRDLYIFHGSLSDFSTGRYHSFQDISRAGPGLAGAAADTLDTFTKAQRLRRRPDGRLALACRTADYALELELTPTFPTPVLHGEEGLSRKGAEPGQASYYYSLPRLATAGMLIIPEGKEPSDDGTSAVNEGKATAGGGKTVTVNRTTADKEISAAGGVKTAVSGLSWYDHEFATNQLGPDQQGWDWVSLHLDDGTCLMLYQMRLTNGGTDPASSGTFIAADGTYNHLERKDFRFEPRNGTWISEPTGAHYPLRRHIVVDRPVQLRLELGPRFEAQEQDARDTTGAAYWEGGVTVRGTTGGGREIAGTGYMELTGYGQQLRIGTAE